MRVRGEGVGNVCLCVCVCVCGLKDAGCVFVLYLAFVFAFSHRVCLSSLPSARMSLFVVPNAKKKKKNSAAWYLPHWVSLTTGIYYKTKTKNERVWIELTRVNLRRTVFTMRAL